MGKQGQEGYLMEHGGLPGLHQGGKQIPSSSNQEPLRKDGPHERLPSSWCWQPPYKSSTDAHSCKGLCVMALSVHCFTELILWSSQSLHWLFLTVAGALERGWYKCPVKAEHSAVTSPSILTTRSLCMNCYPLQKRCCSDQNWEQH